MSLPNLRALTGVGIGISLGWLLIFGWLVWLRWGDAQKMTLNEWGDFLAGGSAPLALLWLVVGYFQQGRELGLNTKALEAQEGELRRQVSATTRLATNAAKQAEAAEALADVTRVGQQRMEHQQSVQAQPKFVATEATVRRNRLVAMKVRNVGETARKIEVEYHGPGSLTWNGPRFLGRNGEAGLMYRPGAEDAEPPIRFLIHYVDGLGEVQRRLFEINESDLEEVASE